MGSGPEDSYKTGQDRVDLNRAVQLRFGKFQDFLTEVASNISPGGMFVSSNNPHPPGEEFDFECSLADGYPLVSGRAEVVWARQRSTSAEQPTGMGVRFLELKDDSEELIRRIVEERIKEGETTFDLEEEGGTSAPSAEEAEPSVDLSDDILVATETLIEESSVLAVSEEPLTELPVEMLPDIDSLVATPKSPPASQPEGGEPEELEYLFAEVSEPEPTWPPEPDGPDPEHNEQPPTAWSPSPAPSVPPVPSAAPRPPQGSSPRESGQAQPRPEPRRIRSAPKPADQRRQARVAASARPLPDRGARVDRTRRGRKRLGFLRFLELVVFSLLAGFGTVLLINQFWLRPRVESLEGSLGELTGSSGIGGPPEARRTAQIEDGEREAGAENPDETVTPAPATGSSAQSDAAADELPKEQMRGILQNWAKAWSGRRVDEYLSYYSADFVPASGATRAAWQARRRDRLLNQGSIRVTVTSLEAREVSPREMRVTFTQSYQSETFRDRVRKTLRMVWEDGAWKIAEEVVVRQLPW